MNSHNRFFNLLAGKPVDHLPAQPILMTFAARQCGVKYSEYLRDHRKLVECQLRMIERFGQDVITFCSDPSREAEDCGAEAVWFEDQPTAHDPQNPFLKNKADLLKLKQPDPLGGGRMHDRIKGEALAKEKVGGEVPILGWIEGPMAEAADLRGINEIMMDLIDDPGFVRDLFDFVLEMELNFARRQLEAGVNIMGIGDAAASLVGPAIYREQIWPYEKKMIDGLHAMGCPVRMHICGNITNHLEYLGQLDLDMIDIDFLTDMTHAREKLGPGPAILGNIEPVHYFLEATPHEVREALAECHNLAGCKFVVGAGCEIPPGAEVENVRAMMEYAREPSL